MAIPPGRKVEVMTADAQRAAGRVRRRRRKRGQSHGFRFGSSVSPSGQSAGRIVVPATDRGSDGTVIGECSLTRLGDVDGNMYILISEPLADCIPAGFEPANEGGTPSKTFHPACAKATPRAPHRLNAIA
ncbi:MAG: hypothetical protein A2017_17550 [Lentisphaerae bacterium GWF2_44_16]|nr:MAG: hypothetical protein A2017_17550 [Lentisphaerae bacterium GWF2_44_16]HAU65881.1 hypothetical protein [Candidatus Uhrbacteria bacterium]